MSHNENMKKLEEIISNQTKGHEDTPVECVGQQLLDIARLEPESAEILVKNLEVGGMGIADAEKEIKKAADEKHQKNKGNGAAVSWREADGILRKFYGLPDMPSEPVKARPQVQETADDEFGLLDLLLGE